MEITNKQEQGLKEAIRKYKEGATHVCISGYAGSGKSTLVKYIIAALNLDPEEDVAYVAYTGKAAEVLRHKGCPNATTAHRLLYKARPLPNGKFKFTPREKLEKDFKVIVVDEISMLPKDLLALLAKHKIFIIACGDPFQLPPINKDTDNHVLDKPDIFLDEIMRQAKESEIIRLTMAIRDYQEIPYYQGKEVQVLNKNEIVSGMYTWADQIITGTNNMRNNVNNLLRQLENRGPEPEVGDKIICLRNNWDILDTSDENALVNGTIGYITERKIQTIPYPLWEKPFVPILYMNFISEANEKFEQIWADYTAVTTGEKYLTPQEEYRLFKNDDAPPAPIEFNYGYAITCHRAQGSQWKKVMVIEERFPFGKEEHARWLYTACTRPEQKLILIK